MGFSAHTRTALRHLRDPSALPDGAGNDKRPSLVVCPKSVMDNWRAETERFASGLKVRVWSAAEIAGFAPKTADLHVVNYSQLRMLGEALSPLLARRDSG